MNDINRPTLEAWTFMWWLAADRQAKRVSEAGVGAAAPDVFIYVDCMRNAYRGAALLLGEDHPEVLRFLAAVPDVKDIRDMLQHFEEYIDGTGWLQKKGLVDQEWLPFASGDIQGDVRRIRIQGKEIELPRDHGALTALVEAAMEKKP